jgi:hypothetical protein
METALYLARAGVVGPQFSVRLKQLCYVVESDWVVLVMLLFVVSKVPLTVLRVVGLV